jgi:hypothetical protein
MRKAEQVTGAERDALEEMKERIDLFLLGLNNPVVTEPGRDVIDLASGNYSLSTEYNKLLLQVWNERTNLVRQITKIQKESAGRMELRFQKFGKGAPGVLIVADSRAGQERLERRGERLRYAQRFRRILAQQFPQWKAEEISSEPDLQRSFSGLYTRGVLSRGQQVWAAIGVGEQEDATAADGILTYGLIWLDWLRRRESRRVVAGLKIFVPPKRSATTLQRLAWMDASLAHWELFETGDEIRPCDPTDAGNLKTILPLARVAATGNISSGGISESFSDVASGARQVGVREQICSLSPAVEIVAAGGGFRAFSVHGLIFAREAQRGVVFGAGRAERLLDEQNFPELERLVSLLTRYRRPETETRLHPYYRLQPEKWLEDVAARQIGVLGFDLVPNVFYRQVLSVSGLERGLMDLLAVTSQGRLAVVEFKASEDIHLPLQALDYWMRVHWHQRRGELENHGYFRGRALSADPPLLLLVAPALQLHSTCPSILRYFSPSIEAFRVGINEQWREHLQVLFREGR